MKLCGLLYKAVIIVLLAFGTPSNTNGKLLKRWLDCPESFSWKNYVWGSTQSCETVLPTSIHWCTQMTNVTALNEGLPNRNQLSTYTGNYDSESELQSRSNYLRSIGASTVFILVSRAKWGNWFLVDSHLKQQDFYIAAHKDDSDPVIMILTWQWSDFAAGLEFKHNEAKKALDYINERENKQFDFLLRISFDWAKVTESQKDAVDEYWENFERETDLPYTLYYSEKFGPNGFFFYGHYETCSTYSTGMWEFVIKELRTGKIIRRMSCSTDKLYCIVDEFF